MQSFVLYLRVSTDKQGRSGLGLEAQREAASRFIASVGGKIAAEFVEVESGKNCERPKLAEALAVARKKRAKLAIAKLDRLGRDVAFVANLMKSDVAFVACDMPDADRFRLHIEAALGEEEARKISDRTKAALQAAKARGVVLGGFRGYVPTAADAAKGHAASRSVRGERAEHHAANVLPHIAQARSDGAESLRDIARYLNSIGVETPRGGLWSAVQVQRALARAAQ